MTSTPQLPSPDNDYTAPVPMRLNDASWNAALNSIGQRLRVIEAQRADLQAVIDAGTTQALAMVNQNITPLITAITAQIDALTTEAGTLSGQFASLLAGGVPADDIVEAADRVFVTPTQKAAIDSLGTSVAANTTNIANNTAAIAANATALANVKTVGFTPVTGNINLVAGSAYRVTAAATLTLPAAPATNDAIRIIDGEIVATGVRPIVAHNGNTIMGASSDLTIDAAGADFILIWNGADWRLF
jgi:hypothetical protein